MKKRSPGIKILMVVLVLGVLAYFGLQAARYYDDPMSTAAAYTYYVEEGAELNGYVVRQEKVLSDDASGLLRLERREGERVSAGGTIATVYADQASLDRQKELESLSAQIEQLEYVATSMLSMEAAEKLDREISGAIVAYRSALAEDRLDTAEEYGQQLRALILKRDYSYTGTENLEAQLEQLNERKDELQNQAASSVRRIKSPDSGLYSAVVDGFENVLTPEILTELMPSDLAKLEADDSTRSRAGKLVLGDEWYYVASMQDGDVSALAEAGNRAVLRFGKGIDRDLAVEVATVSDAEDGQRVVVFRSREHLAMLTLLRGQSAKLVWNTISGIRVPNAALRVLKTTVKDENGAETERETVGIYCIVGAKAQFKSVEVLYSGNDFSVVRSASGTESGRIRSGEQVIVQARDLFDGKVVL